MVQDTGVLADRAAIISDPHANLRGVELCYKKIKSMGIDQIFCCGDVVGYGHEPNQVVEFFSSHDIRTISGNHDRLVCGQCQRESWSSFALEKVDWTKSVITDSNFAYLYKLPLNMVADDYCIVHGAWSDPDKYLFEKEDFLEESDATGFSRLIREMVERGILEVQVKHRYRHRFSVDRRPLYYSGIIAKKKAAIHEQII